MKSKMVLVAVVLAVVSILAGCEAVVKQGIYTEMKNEAQAQEKEKNLSKDNEPIGYEISRKVSENQDSNAKIFYPQISGYKGELLMGYMNQSLKKIVDGYGKGDTYRDINIDYKITKTDKDIISVLFRGTGKISGGKEINIQQSVNLDIKTSNAIEYDNLIKADQASGTAVRAIINQKAEAMGLKSGAEFERVRIYFEGENVVFFYMPADDNETRFIEISVPIKEFENHLNTDFGEKPAS